MQQVQGEARDEDRVEGEDPRATPGWITLRIMMYHRSIMRTTVDLPDHLLIEAKKLAAERHSSLTRIVEESLRSFLADQRLALADREPLPLPTLKRPRPLIGLDDTSRLWELD